MIERDGYRLWRGIFTPDFLTLMEGRLEKDPKLCLAFCMGHPTVNVIARQLTGTATPGRTGEEHVNVNPTAPLYDEWHFDAPWESDHIVPMWRFAVYFRDYTANSGGLQVVPQSHLGPLSEATDTTKRVLVKSRPGDLVVWNLRTFHAAGADNDGKPHATPRNAIFFDYAAPGRDLDRYVAWRAEVKAKREAAEAAAKEAASELVTP